MTENNQPKKYSSGLNACREKGTITIDRSSYWTLPPASLSIPTKGSAGKTGNWRVYRPVIDLENCIKCYFCYMYCPEGVISVIEDSGFVQTDYDYCKGCGMCAANCPKKCIAMELEKK